MGGMTVVAAVVLLIVIALAFAVTVAGVPLTGQLDTLDEAGEEQAYTVTTAATIYRGALCGVVTAAGTLSPMSDAAGLLFVGVAKGSTTLANFTAIGAAPAGQKLVVKKRGCFWFNAVTGVTFAATDTTKEVYANSDNQASITAGDQTNQYKIGRIQEVDLVANRVKVRIDNYTC